LAAGFYPKNLSFARKTVALFDSGGGCSSPQSPLPRVVRLSSLLRLEVMTSVISYWYHGPRVCILWRYVHQRIECSEMGDRSLSQVCHLGI